MLFTEHSMLPGLEAPQRRANWQLEGPGVAMRSLPCYCIVLYCWDVQLLGEVMVGGGPALISVYHLNTVLLCLLPLL